MIPTHRQELNELCKVNVLGWSLEDGMIWSLIRCGRGLEFWPFSHPTERGNIRDRPKSATHYLHFLLVEQSKVVGIAACRPYRVFIPTTEGCRVLDAQLTSQN